MNSKRLNCRFSRIISILPTPPLPPINAIAGKPYSAVITLLCAVLLGACAGTPRNHPGLLADSEKQRLELEAAQSQKQTLPPGREATGTTLANRLVVLDSTAQPLTDPSSSILPAEFDIWERIRAGYAISGEHNSQIEYWTRFYASRKKHLLDSAENARPFLHHIVEQLEARGMPTELALLPLVESSFDPFAGGGQRASGLWQFMPVTGRRFGMDYELGYQARRDIVLSTRAALDYLSWLHARYNDWYLALAAYNAGEGRVDRALEEAQTLGQVSLQFWNLRLPEETTNYVPKLIAFAHLVAEPDRFDIVLPGIENQPAFAAVELPANIRLADAAEVMDVPPDHLVWLNPALESGQTPPSRSHALLVPTDRAQLLVDSLNKLSPAPPIKPRPPKTYRVRPGDTLWQIARQHKLTIKQLSAWNNLKNAGAIRSGMTLRLTPANDHGTAFSKSYQAQAKTLFYRVKAGDNLWRIARQHGVQVGQLCGWNKMSSSDQIKPGQKLKIVVGSI